MKHYLIYLFFLLPPAAGPGLFAQTASVGSPVAEALWPLVEARLEQPNGDTAQFFILEMVRRHCGQDFDCLFGAYHDVMLKLERRFNLPNAILVAGEMAKIAAQKGELNKEAQSHRNLSRFHGAMGSDQPTIAHLEKALRLYEQTSNQSSVINTKAAILEQRLNYRGLAETLPELEALLEKAIENKDTRNVTYLHLRLVIYTQQAGFYDQMERHVSYLENLPLSDPVKPVEYGEAIHAAMGRADLFVAKKNYPEAARFYQKTLRLCEAEPSRWLEIKVLHSLAMLEWERKNSMLAKTYLDSAAVKAERLQLHDHLATTFELKATIAEAEKRYFDALDFTKKKALHQQEFDKRGAGFNLESYYLRLEKEQLALEKQSQALQLQLKNSQLRNSLLITGLVLLLAAGLFFGLRKQRQGKQELAAQNTLIRQQSEKLQQLDTARSRFFANISHELRTPLTLLLGAISAIRKDNHLTEKQGRLLELASSGGDELGRLIHEILDLGKLDADKMEVNQEPVQVASFFTNFFAQFESLAERKGVHFTFESQVDDGIYALLDKVKCRQTVYNLLSNAFKFTHENGTVRCALRLENGKIQLEVSDTGDGIHPDDLPHIFERYFQTKQADAAATGGTGIGLALCLEYIRLLGGNIEVKSELGKGTEFVVSFPVRLVEHEAASIEISPERLEGTPPASASSPGFSNEKNTPSPRSAAEKPAVLVVEDNPELQTYFRLILEEKFQVVLAGNGKEALAVLQSGGPPTARLKPDLILSDLMMPVMDGYQLLEQLKSDTITRHIPVIMLTARAEAKDRLKALRIGVDDYLTKPFDEEELLVRIDNLLKNKAVRQAEATAGTVAEKAAVPLPATDQEWLENFEKHIREHLSSDLLTVPLLAHRFAMSESTLLRQLKRLTGLTPQQYLQEMRLDKARQLLEERSGRSIAKIADEVGYSDVRSFSRSFKGRFGRLPSDYLTL